MRAAISGTKFSSQLGPAKVERMWQVTVAIAFDQVGLEEAEAAGKAGLGIRRL